MSNVGASQDHDFFGIFKMYLCVQLHSKLQVHRAQTCIWPNPKKNECNSNINSNERKRPLIV